MNIYELIVTNGHLPTSPRCATNEYRINSRTESQRTKASPHFCARVCISALVGANNKYIASTWDNRHLISITWGYKIPRNIELGLKFRYQGGSPYTEFDENLSRLNYLSTGKGTFDYNRLNSQRIGSFNSSDVRIDKKWNLKNITIDLFLDVTNWHISKNPAIPEYTFQRNAANTAFVTTDGQPIKADGSNAIPTRVKNDDPFVTPTVGLIVEF